MRRRERMVRAFQNIYGQARECLGYSRRTLREGKLPAAFHRLAKAIDANRTLAAFALVVLFGLIAGGAMFQTTAAITERGHRRRARRIRRHPDRGAVGRERR